jgi:hypothetical protein
MADYTLTWTVIEEIRALLSSLTVKKYLRKRPTRNSDTEYIIINSFPVNADVMQKCIVNVNYHVKDLSVGIPDADKLKAGSEAVLTILKKVTTTDLLIDFDGQETVTEEGLEETYENLRFSVKIINN